MGKQTKRRWQLPQLTTKAKIIVGLVVFFFVALLTVYIVTSILAKQAVDSKGYDIAQIRKDLESKDTVDRKSTAAASAYDASRSGNSDKASAIYEQALAIETDPSAKVRLAIDRSEQLYRSGKYNEALDVAKRAEMFSSDRYLISAWLGQLYEVGKQYSEAARYYLSAGTLAESTTNESGFTKEFYDRKAAALKSLEGKAK